MTLGTLGPWMVTVVLFAVVEWFGGAGGGPTESRE
jgi:hypothetical protein